MQPKNRLSGEWQIASEPQKTPWCGGGAFKVYAMPDHFVERHVGEIGFAGSIVPTIVSRRTLEDAVAILKLRQHEQRIQVLERDFAELKEVAFNGGIVVPLDSLASHQLTVIKTIHAHLRIVDDTYMACFIDANLNAAGDSELDAIDMLKSRIASAFLYYSENEGILGLEPARQLAVLREFVQQINGPIPNH